jgi:hypothetical protein
MIDINYTYNSIKNYDSGIIIDHDNEFSWIQFDLIRCVNNITSDKVKNIFLNNIPEKMHKQFKFIIVNNYICKIICIDFSNVISS